jgi:hypothetical protein
MKKKIVLLLAALVCFVGLLQSAHAQGSGCPAEPTPVGTPQYQVVETAILIAPAVPEANSLQARGSYYQNRVVFNYKPGWRVVLSSTADGTGFLCTDDYVEIRASSGRVWSHDYRSPALDAVLPMAPVDLTFLFEPGEQEVAITLIDMMSPKYGSSGYFIAAVIDPATPTPTATASATSTPKPTITPTPTATSTPSSTTTPKPTLIPAPSATVSPSATASPVPNKPAGNSLLRRVAPLAVVALLAKIILGLVVFGMVGAKQLVPPGEEDVYLGDQWQETVSLDQFGKDTVSFGKDGDVVLTGEDMPTVAARIFALSTNHDVVAMLEILDPEDPEKVLEVHELKHGDSHLIAGRYRLVYKLYQPEGSFLEEEDFDA